MRRAPAPRGRFRWHGGARVSRYDACHDGGNGTPHPRRRPRKATPPCWVAIFPFKSYETVADAVANAQRLVAAGAEFVKAEGGREILPQVAAIVAAGIPFCGHLGMLPQHVLEEGGYHIKGKKDAEHENLLADAPVRWPGPASLRSCWNSSPRRWRKKSPNPSPRPPSGSAAARTVTARSWSPTISSAVFPWFTPRFVKPKANCAGEIRIRRCGLETRAATGSKMNSALQPRRNFLPGDGV